MISEKRLQEARNDYYCLLSVCVRVCEVTYCVCSACQPTHIGGERYTTSTRWCGDFVFCVGLVAPGSVVVVRPRSFVVRLNTNTTPTTSKPSLSSTLFLFPPNQSNCNDEGNAGSCTVCSCTWRCCCWCCSGWVPNCASHNIILPFPCKPPHPLPTAWMCRDVYTILTSFT